MREIKFRVWDSEFKEMTKWEDIRIFEDEKNLFQCFEEHGRYFYQQFTGFPDKNGKDVYSGDILAGHKCHFPVEFVNGAFMWGGDFLGYDLEGDHDCMVHITKTDCSTLEIIGNVYENPELLKKQR